MISPGLCDKGRTCLLLGIKLKVRACFVNPTSGDYRLATTIKGHANFCSKIEVFLSCGRDPWKHPYMAVQRSRKGAVFRRCPVVELPRPKFHRELPVTSCLKLKCKSPLGSSGHFGSLHFRAAFNRWQIEVEVPRLDAIEGKEGRCLCPQLGAISDAA